MGHGPGSTVEVRIVKGALLYHEGRAYHTGHVLRVPEADARSLVEQGVAERVERKRGRKS